ncbi:polysaccharide biosynthesis/export family protein [Affinirhizobium pseudoryzae]|uniref:polysaccharide biosynthesis/export family protein n=1 Tax=Allorhizobium pseudoryzae TaxID=379684 RepID=UPI0013ECD561|nr:polysaccharide biosynthesis/export family protein [Allorhizobium pseudoryzae]
MPAFSPLFPHLRRCVRSALVSAALLGAAPVFTGPASQAAEMAYQLGPMDKLRVRVAQWVPAEGVFRSWDALSGDYSVGADGNLSLPFVGSISVSGKSPDAVAGEIGAALQQQFALRDPPSASVEIAQFRPVFLAGDVQTPGEYPFMPNMTVLKAVSIAGGLRRSESGQRFERDFINAQGDLSVYDSQRARLIARHARLEAELNGASDIAMPKELEKVANASDLIRSETALMKQRRDRYELQLKALADLKALLQKEVASLEEKSKTQERQLEIAEQDRDKISRLNEQGLALSSRLLSIEERTAEVQSTLLDIDTNILRAKQQISQADQDEINLKNDWEAQRAKDMQDTEAELEKLTLQIGTNRQLMAEALTKSAEALRFDPAGRAVSIRYSIIRETADGPKEIAADEATRLQPGDVVRARSEMLVQ